MAIEEKEKKDPMAVMAESFKTLTDFMTQMGADRAEERQEREKERQELRVEREQSSKMLNDLLSKLTVNGNTASISSVGPSIDALEARIIEFVYDEEECTFESWFSRYEYIFAVEAKSMDDEKKVLMLMRHLSMRVLNQYRDHISPLKETDKKFDETVTILTGLFGKKISEFEWRLRFLKMSMTSERIPDVRQFASEVNRLYQKGSLKDIEEEAMKVTVFLAGLDVPNMKNVRMQLLSAVNSKQGITLNELVEKWSTMQALERDAGVVGMVSDKVHAVYSVPKKKPSMPRTGAKTNGKELKCFHCQKIGHIRDECWSLHPDRRPAGKRGKKKACVLQCNRVCDRIYREVKVNGKSVTFLVDTGADVTVISRRTWQRIGSPTMSVAEKRPMCANDTPLELIGQSECEMELDSKKFSHEVYVAESTSDLLGNDLFWKLGVHETLGADAGAVVNRVEVKDYEQMVKQEYPEICEAGLGRCTRDKAKMELKHDARPVFRCKRPVPFASQHLMDGELDRLVTMKVITKIEHSKWASPVLMVKKKNGTVRLCADFSTGLNDALEDCNHPLPIPEEMVNQLNGGAKFSTVDLSDAYLQVELEEDSKKLLVINTHRGLYQYERMPFGVKTAPGCFQQIMDRMVAGLQKTFAYLDDVIVTGATDAEHDQNLKALLARLRDYGFRIRPEKCTFGKRSISFLGFVVDRNGRRPEREKIEVIQKMPSPKDVAQLRSFLGSVNYYGSYVKNLSTLRVPLEKLLKKGEKFIWNDDCQKAFEAIKKVLSSDLVLTHYDPKLPIVVAADASNYGIGGVLSHRMPDGSEKVVLNFSKSLNPAEVKYGQIEKEALALVFAVKKFHKFIYGRSFTLQTDHRPLLSVFGSKKGIPAHSANRLQRWALILLAYDFRIEYVNTDSFGKADVLSRLITEFPRENEDRVIAVVREEEDDVEFSLHESVRSLPVNVRDVQRATLEDKLLQRVKKCLEEKWPEAKKVDSELMPFFQKRESIAVVKQCLMIGERVIVPNELQKRVLTEFHRGHPGIVRMKSLARLHAFWPGMDSEVERMVKECGGCAKAAKQPVKAPLHPWIPSSRPFERVHVDFAGPMRGKHYMVYVDSYSKYPEIELMDRITSSSTVRQLKRIFSRYGAPETIVSDNGTQFASREFAEMCDEFGVKHIFSPPYHPQSNGQAERFVDIFKRSLLKMKGEGVESDVIQEFLMSYRSTPNRQLNGKTPSEVFLGRNMRTRVDVMKPRQWSHENESEKSSMARDFDRRNGAKHREFTANDQVYYIDRDGPNHLRWTEATVLARVGFVMYEIQKSNGKTVRAHVNQLRKRHVERETDEDQWMILNDTFGIPVEDSPAEPRSVVVPSPVASPVMPRATIAPASPIVTASPPRVDIRRSSRSRQAPKRLIEEM